MGVPKIAPEEMIEVKRRKNRERQADYRERIRLASTEVTADEMFDVFPERFPAQHAAMTEYSKKFKAVVAGELGVEVDDDDTEYILDKIAKTLYSFENGLIYRVISRSGASGELLGGIYWADSLGLEIIESTRKYGLERSSTYSAVYRELLGLLDRRYGKNNNVNANAVRAELKGKG